MPYGRLRRINGPGNGLGEFTGDEIHGGATRGVPFRALGAEIP